jgi:hypothetical protein
MRKTGKATKGHAAPKASRPRKDTKRNAQPLGLYPLSFDEAVSDILKIKPEPKTQKKRKK